MAAEGPPRKKMRRDEHGDGPRFITFSCHRQLPLLGNPLIRDLCAAELAAARSKYGLRVLAWVLMPEHVHVILRSPQGSTSIVKPLWAWKREVALQVIGRWRQLKAPVLERIRDASGRPRFWQRGGGYDRNLDSELDEKIRYIHQNPVRRGLVQQAHEWRWSSIHWYRREGEILVPIDREGRDFADRYDPPGSDAGSDRTSAPA
jgi:putative transposase